MRTEPYNNSALHRWLASKLSDSSDCTFFSSAENLAIARPEDVIAYVTPGYAEKVLREARVKFSDPSVPDGFSIWKEIRLSECGVSPDHLRLYQSPAFPPYINNLVAKGPLFHGILERSKGLADVYVREPAIHILHPQCRVYGHFLLEAVIKIPLIFRLYEMGYRLPVFVPFGFPFFVKKILLEILPKNDLFFAKEGVNYLFRSVVSPHFNKSYILSPSQIDWCSGLFLEQRDAEGSGPLSADRLFVIRTNRNALRHLGRIEELREELQKSGFQAVSPQVLDFSQQCNLFRRAKVIAGDYSSSLHNMIFSRSGTKLISFNYITAVQTAIGLSRSHKISYIAPKGTGFINQSNTKAFTEYVVDMNEVRRVLDLMECT